MRQTIFYSWQSDLPSSTNRSLIEKAAEKAASTIRSDDSLNVEPVIDRDTKGMPGSPNIATTILDKISACSIFLADVSIIGRPGRKKRPTPNPNVLVELGYAIHAIGPERIVLVMNTDRGGPSNLPFDLSAYRSITYSPDSGSTPSIARQALQRDLQAAFESILTQVNIATHEVSTLLQEVHTGSPGRLASAQSFTKLIEKRLDDLAPNYEGLSTEQEVEERLITQLDKTKQVVDEFAVVAEQIAICKDADALIALSGLFGSMLSRYGSHQDDINGDFYKVLAYEMFLLYVSPLVYSRDYDLLAKILDLQLRYTNPDGALSSTDYISIGAAYTPIMHRKAKKEKRLSAVADWIHTRREVGRISSTNIGWQEIREVDLLLFIHSGIRYEEDASWFMWAPYTSIFSGHGEPLFLSIARRKDEAIKLGKLLKQESFVTMRDLLRKRADLMRHITDIGPMIGNPILSVDPEELGTIG